MNERIEELARQCMSMHFFIDTASEDFDYKKFAELIIKDMCDMMEQAEDDAYHCIEPSERPTEYIEWLNQWRTIFEERFGEQK